jgi:hypothetical protein
MPPSNISKPSRSSRHTRNTDATSNVEKSKKSSASSRGPEFEQHLIDHRIYPEGYEYPEDRSTPEPSNLTQILQDLSVPRASLSPSYFPDSEFRNFKRNNTRVVLEDDVMNDIIPTICGNTDIPHKKNIMFTELEPITNEKATKPKPDFFDSSRLEDVDTRVLKERYMYSSIVPTKHPRVPVAPNFFLEAKRHDGCAAVMKRQACYDGAYGTRAMHSLQNSGRENFVYDNNAYTLSSTYHAGTSTLHLYAHHSTAPTTSGDRPEYHMTQLQAHALTNKRETFVEGVAALRNARDLAKRYRDNLIEAANARARQSDALSGQDDHAHINVTCDNSPVLRAAMVDSRSVAGNADDHLQQDIWDQSCSGLSAPQSQHMEEGLRDSSQAFAELGPTDPSTGFVAGSSSDFRTDRTTSKRSRPSPSPSSSSGNSHATKSRSRRATES